MQSLHKFKNTKFGEIPEDWFISSIEDIGLNFGDAPFGSQLKSVDYRDSGIPIIQGRNIKNNKFKWQEKLYVTKEKFASLPRSHCKTGDLVFQKIGTIGIVAILPEIEGKKEFLLSTNMMKMSTKPEISSINYIYYYFCLDKVRDQIIKNARGTTQAIFNYTTLKKFLVFYPPLKEQQKIISILSRVDDLIQKTEQIIEQTQRLKKGLMQKLLTKGIGHTKFEKIAWNYDKKMEIPKEWKVVFLDEVAKRGTGHTPDAKKLEYYNGGIKWVSLADSNRLDNIYISETTKEISEIGIENSSAVKHPAGTVILSRDAGVGKSAILKTEMAVSQHFIAWQCRENLNNYFLYYLLQYWKPVFESIAIGTTIKTIGLPFFKKLRIPLPHINEQKKIAFFLLNIDELIQTQKNKKTYLENLKKGLMQQLLTGKIRVKV